MLVLICFCKLGGHFLLSLIKYGQLFCSDFKVSIFECHLSGLLIKEVAEWKLTSGFDLTMSGFLSEVLFYIFSCLEFSPVVMRSQHFPAHISLGNNTWAGRNSPNTFTSTQSKAFYILVFTVFVDFKFCWLWISKNYPSNFMFVI